MTLELGRALLLSGAVTSDSLSEALLAVATQGVPLVRALLTVGALTERRLEQELARGNVPTIDRVVPLTELMDELPAGLCHRLFAVPVRAEPGQDAIDIAVLDPRDTHAAHEIGYHLRRPVRMVRASYRALREALDLYPVGVQALAAPMGMAHDKSYDPDNPRTLAWGTPAPNWDQIYDAVAEQPAIRPNRPLSDIPIPLTRPPAYVRLDDATHDGPRRRPRSEPPPETEFEPIFELRRLGPPPTIPEPEPPTIQMAVRETPAFPLRAPLPSRAPLAPNAPSPPFADVGAILASIRAAEDRDAILGLVQLGVRSVARRVGLLVVKKDAIVGWSCTPEFGDEATLRALRIPTGTPSLLTSAMSGGVYLGPLLGSVSAPLLRVMRTATHDLAIAAIKVSDRAAVLIIADELGDTLLGTKRIEELGRAGGEALTRVVRSRK